MSSVAPRLVSIVMPNRNGGRTIGDAIQSVVDQTYPHWELLVVDNDSSDDSPNIIQSFLREDPRIRSFQQLSTGDPGAVRNLGIHHAQGTYLAFLDSDDLWVPTKLERHLAFMQERSAGLSTTGTEIIDEDSQPLGSYLPPILSAGWEQMLLENVVSTSAVLIDRSQCSSVHFPSLRFCQDYAAWMNLVRQGHLVHFLSEPLTKHRIRTRTFLPEKLQKARYRWRVYREVLHLDRITALQSFIRYLVLGVRKSVGYFQGPLESPPCAD